MLWRPLTATVPIAKAVVTANLPCGEMPQRGPKDHYR